MLSLDAINSKEGVKIGAFTQTSRAFLGGDITQRRQYEGSHTKAPRRKDLEVGKKRAVDEQADKTNDALGQPSASVALIVQWSIVGRATKYHDLGR
jgi:hypothetical protein